MLSRRGLIATAALWPVSQTLVLPNLALAASETVKVGVLPFGTASWEAAIIKARKLDEAHGFTLETVKLAGNDAARIAFQGGQVDTIVSDLIWAARVSSEGRAIRFSPYSTTEGALMVPAASPIGSIKDLAGRRIGVAGGALDKNWILLKAQAREVAGLDLDKDAKPAFGAPPLLMQKLQSGELEAALLYWTFCSRLEAKGFKRLIGADDVMRSFGAKGSVALLGYLFQADTVAKRPDDVRAFLSASRAAKELLANEAGAWDVVRPLMAAEDDETFETLKRNFLAGVPRRAVSAEREDGQLIYATLVRLGGDQLVGAAKTLPEDLYFDDAKNG